MTSDVIPHVMVVTVIPPFGLDLEFNDHTRRRIDLTHALQTVLRGPVSDPLHDPDYFALAHLDEEGGTVAWPNGADIAPIALYEDEW
jgi:hypothetical protein